MYDPRLTRRLLRLAGGLYLAARHGWPRAMIWFGQAPGDDLLCTAVAREWRRRERGRLWVISQHPQLFAGNPDVALVLPQMIESPRFQAMFRQRGGQVLRVNYPDPDPALDLTPPPPRHLITVMCLRAGISGRIALRPYLSLTAGERRWGPRADRQVAIMSSGLVKARPMGNKEWGPERFQEVVDRLKGRYQFVQLGAVQDPLLCGATDLRGRTTLRQAGAVLSQSLAFVGQVGFLMHLARAVDCPSVIVYGGREAPWQSGYSCNTNLYTPVPCAPCWLWNRCDYGHECMKRIRPDSVAEALESLVERGRAPLAVDYDELAAEPAADEAQML